MQSFPKKAQDFGGPEEDALTARLFPPLPGTVKWGLERTERILAAVGDPHRSYPTLHVGGTNGKGSVARIWAEILRAAGHRTALYTSPHLVSFRERILVNGRPVPDDLLVSCADELRPHFERESPSFFEAATALAFLAFARAGAEIAVVEVGLGGRLDATNVIAPLMTAVTNVSMDHGEMLGATVVEIAREKAGIFKRDVPAFTASDDPAVLEVLEGSAQEVGTTLRGVVAPSGRTTLDGSRLRVETERWGGLELASSLVGTHQMRNIALAVGTLEALPAELSLPESAVREGVLRTRVPGRFQMEREGELLWVLDAAHNPGGAEALARTLASVSLPRPRVALLGVLADKDGAGILQALSSSADHFVLTVPESAPVPRRWNPAEAAAALPPGRTVVVPDFGEALETVSRLAAPSGTIVVAGSSHTVGDAMKRRGWIPAEALPGSFDSG
ncbi:MAG: folylpolyglutamate synthase/dihydrofolate synthase family protein [Gemmatimonadota bacterium]